jgi:hypothetical protein
MTEVKKDYSKLTIYKIACNDLNIKDVYVGHTTDFIRRKYEHKCCCTNDKSKKYNLKVYDKIRQNGGWNNWSMVEVEKFACDNSNQASLRERHFFELLNASLNSYRPIITKDENNEYAKKYRDQHKDKMKEYLKDYRQRNKDKIKQYYRNKKNLKNTLKE